MANEEWRTIKGFEKYEVSNYGRVRSKDRVVIRNDGHKLTLKGKLLKPITDHKGYVNVSIYNSNGIKISHVHRLVAIAFIENPNMLPQVNHKDGNKKNNNVNNLEWCDNEYNQLHAIAHGLRKTENVIQYDKKGNFIKEWDNATSVKKALNIDNGHIGLCCKGIRKTAGGYIWKYANRGVMA